MNNWIPFVDGEYLVDQALLLAAEDRAVAIDEVIVEVYSDQKGQRHLRGRGRVRNTLMVELLRDSDELDLLLDFGGEFKFLLKAPNLQAGKVFSPDVKSTLQFIPTIPWHQMDPSAYEAKLAKLNILPD
ncbi:MAG: hypothetical protein PVF37_08990 [Desulfobacterales bacterium]|jgi:hypothetical protein